MKTNKQRGPSTEAWIWDTFTSERPRTIASRFMHEDLLADLIRHLATLDMYAADENCVIQVMTRERDTITEEELQAFPGTLKSTDKEAQAVRYECMDLFMQIQNVYMQVFSDIVNNYDDVHCRAERLLSKGHHTNED